MKIEYKFRHMSHSQELTAYVDEHAARLAKFEMKPVRVEFTFAVEKSVKHVHAHVRGEGVEMHAESEGETFFAGVDAVLDKLGRQLEKKKTRTQKHKGAAKVS